MLLPIGDTPTPRGFTSWVNWALIAANIGIYLVITLPLSGQTIDPSGPLLLEYLDTIANRLPSGVHPLALLQQTSAYDLYTFAHGYKPGAPELSDLLSSMFLHGNLAHLGGNMLFLWIFGDNIEHRLGRLGYLAAYLGTGVAATLTFSVVAGESMVPLVGASGAISGVLGLYFHLCPTNRVKVFVALFPILFRVVSVPARIVLGVYLIVDNVLPVVLGADTGVAYGAHLGGFVGGYALARLGGSAGWRWPFRRPTVSESRPEPALPGTVGAIRDAVADGDAEAAFGHLANLDSHDLEQLDPDTCVRLAGWLDEAGYPGAAYDVLRACVAQDAPPEAQARVHLALGEQALEHGQTTVAYQHLRHAIELDPSSTVRTRAEVLMRRIESDGPWMH